MDARPRLRAPPPAVGLSRLIAVLRSRLLSFALLACIAWYPASGQGNGALTNRQATELVERISDLLEATLVVMPELSRAGAPLQENFRQGALTLQTAQSRNHTGILYRMLLNAKAYLQLSDTLPKPPEFGEDIANQIAELRNGIQRFEAHLLATLDDRELQLLGADRDNLRRYAEDNRLVSPAAPDEFRVVFLGDSITDGWRLNQYFTGKPYLNRGISGQITGQMLGRAKADVIDLGPRALVVLGGTNDLARGVPDATIRNNLEAIGTLAEAAGLAPILASILPVNDYHKERNPRFLRTQARSPARISALNRWMAALCRSKGWSFVDYHSAMIDSDGRLKIELSDDGLHPNPEGYKVMAPLVQKAVDSLVGATLSGPRRRSR